MIYQGYGRKIGCGDKFYWCSAYKAQIGSGRKKRPIPGCKRPFRGTLRRGGVILIKKHPRPLNCKKCSCRSNNGIINIRDPCTFSSC